VRNIREKSGKGGEAFDIDGLDVSTGSKRESGEKEGASTINYQKDRLNRP